MVTLKRTNSDDTNFQDLVKDLDKELKIRDGEDHSFFAQFNKIDMIRYALVAYHGNEPVGCGAIKPYDEKTMEVKRMFVPLTYRGQGIASLVLQDLEKWAQELGFEKCILETGEKQPEAIKLYQKNKYRIIPNFGQYADIESSICFEKIISL